MWAFKACQIHRGDLVIANRALGQALIVLEVVGSVAYVALVAVVSEAGQAVGSAGCVWTSGSRIVRVSCHASQYTDATLVNIEKSTRSSSIKALCTGCCRTRDASFRTINALGSSGIGIGPNRTIDRTDAIIPYIPF